MVTTAVVAIVGVDIATHELINDPTPEVCEIIDLASTENTISFSLKLGDTVEEALNQERGKECELFVELTCDSYETQSIAIQNYGFQSYTFKNLAEKTKYTIDVIQYSLLDFRKSVRTDLEKGGIKTIETLEGVKYTDSISLEIEVDPLGNDIYYSTINYKDTLGIHLYDFCLNVYNDDPSTGNPERMAWSNLDSEDPYSRQKVEWSQFRGINATPYFALMATTDDEEYISTHANNNTSGRPEDERDIILFSQQIDIENLPRPQMSISENRIFVQRVEEESPSAYYHRFYFATPHPEGTYEELLVSITNARDDSNVSSTMHTAGTTKAMNTPLDMDLNFGSSGEYETFNITLKGVSHLQEDVDEWNATHDDPSSGPATTDGGVEVTICSETINFDLIDTVTVEYEPQASITGFMTVSSYFSEPELFVEISKNDPGYHIRSMSLEINETEYELEYYEGELIEGNYEDHYKVKGAGALCDGTTDNVEFVLYAQSDYQMTYNRTQKVTLEEGEDDFSELDYIYYNGCLSMQYVSDGDSYKLQVSVNYDGSYYESFYIVIYGEDGSVLDIDGVEATITVTEANTATETTIPELTGTYEVTTFGVKDYQSALYTEIINFSLIQRSV